ncbi:MAG: NAD(P)/FAD-dependent oxidoreductase [Marivibrio sp.]|uniref:NAD(P)/FAD-dependent oxidoreductase n=1 Tax=Marivibrio sp. TaxID=2039719 RepID=UPI0032F09172
MPSPAPPEQFDAVILGAGAAGLMCALTAGQAGARVLLLDHADKPGKKILISGGGRCNFTNLESGPAAFLSANPHFCKSALARYTQWDFIEMVSRHGIAWHEKTLGQLFCDGSAREIVDMLLAECQAGGVDLRLSHRVTDIARAERFRIETDRGAFEAPNLVLATGGPSIPKMGASGFAYDAARRFGLRVIDPEPALVPLTLGAAALDLAKPLSGVAFDCTAACAGARFREAALFTHRGLSGPAILQVSSYWRPGDAVSLDMAPGVDAAAALVEAKRARPKIEPQTMLAGLLPARLAKAVAADALPARRVGDIADKTLSALGERLNRWIVEPVGTEGFAKAEVTRGGVGTDGLSSKTMAAKDVPGLYVIGEALDVTGWLGGYNFQWAWSSGWAAGRAIGARDA